MLLGAFENALNASLEYTREQLAERGKEETKRLCKNKVGVYCEVGDEEVRFFVGTRDSVSKGDTFVASLSERWVNQTLSLIGLRGLFGYDERDLSVLITGLSAKWYTVVEGTLVDIVGEKKLRELVQVVRKPLTSAKKNVE